MTGRRYIARLPVEDWEDLGYLPQVGRVRVVCMGTGPGPRNCLCELGGGMRFVRPFRGMRRVRFEQHDLFGGGR